MEDDMARSMGLPGARKGRINICVFGTQPPYLACGLPGERVVVTKDCDWR